MARLPLVMAGVFFVGASTAQSQASVISSERDGPRATSSYSLYISSESADLISRIDVGPEGWKKGNQVSVKTVPNEIAGPHNVTVAPNGRFWYVSIAHGTPFGAVWKFATGTDSLVKQVAVGMFPTTVALSPGGDWAYVPNSDFHGDRGRVNTVSAIYTSDLRQVAQIPACDMPHGARWNRGGTRVYVACMMSDELLVIDPGRLAVDRRVALGSGTPMSMAEHQRHEAARADSVRAAPGAASSTLPGQQPDCLTTYVTLAPNDSLIYLACNHSNELQIRDARTLALMRRLPTGAGAYNVEASPDGRLVIVSNKKDQSVSVFDARSWTELRRIPTSKKVPHGIAYSPDGHYAFVTCESVGTDPGAVDAIDLTTLTRVASMELPLQPTGIAVWRRQP